MKIILEQPLKNHMEAEDLHDIIAEVGQCIACGGAYKNVNARFVEQGEHPDPALFDIHETEMGKVYLPREGVQYGETLRFVWKSYYWLDGMGVSGAQAIQE